MDPFAAQNVVCTEVPQEFDENQDALDAVVDPRTEFQSENNAKSPNDAYNLPTPVPSRKQSFINLIPKSKSSPKGGENELARVHKSSGILNTINMLRKEISSPRLTSESSETSRQQCDETASISSGICTPTIKDITYSSDSPILPLYVNDRVETASNISISSNLTDIPGSMSSDITGYEEELFQIKKLVIHGSNQSLYQPNNFSHNENNSSIYETKIEELESQLQETLAQNELYKFHLKDLENKTDLLWQEKYQEVMRQKAQCEGQIEHLKRQYESSISEKDKILNNLKHGNKDKYNLRAEFSKIQSKLNSYEKHNSDLQSKLLLSCNESKQWQTEFLKTESENEKLRITLQEMKSEIDSKNSILYGLKNKITEQHITIQNHIQSKLKLNNQIINLNNEINTTKKSEKWYTDELHTCQLAKTNIQQELMTTQTNLISANQKTENMRMEINHWKNVCEEIQRKAMREKEKLLRKVEMIEADILEREAILKCTETESGTQIEMNYVSKAIDYEIDYQMIVQDYEEQLVTMKKMMGEQNTTIVNLNKHISEYLVRVTTLQKQLNERELNTQLLENHNKDLEMKCGVYSENLRDKDADLLELKNKIVGLEVALHGANQEKQEIDEVVKNIRDDFSKFMKCYQSMKEKLEEKSRTITQFESEKQELFMESNWKVCQIEELQQKVLNLKGHQAEFVQLKNTHNQLTIDQEILEKTVEEIRSKNEELESVCDSLKNKILELESAVEIESEIPTKLDNKEISNLENAIVKLNNLIQHREEQLLNQTQNCEILNNEILSKEKIIADLQEKLLESINSLEIGNNISTDLENTNYNLEIKIKELHKKLNDANIVIDQFNTLCRNSELEKHNLANQLNQLKIQLSNNKIPIPRNIIERKDSNTQTLELETISQSTENQNSELEKIKHRLIEIITDNNNISNNLNHNMNCNDLDQTDTLFIIHEYLNKILSLKQSQIKNLEASDRSNKHLRIKLFKLKNKTEKNVLYLSDRCSKLDNNYAQIQYILDTISKNHTNNKMTTNVSSIDIQTDLDLKDNGLHFMKEIKDLKTLLRVTEVERKEQYKRFETNNRTLLKKVKEHMRGRKIAEKKLHSLEETYTLAISEINNSKIVNNRLELELSIFKNRYEEYKTKCDKLNEEILELEKQNSQIAVSDEPSECINCLDRENLKRQINELEYKFKEVEEKIHWYGKEISDKDQGITECKKQLFNEKLQVSALKKQLSSVQMCLDNANEQLDNNQVEIAHLKTVIEKLENNEKVLTDQLANAHIQYQECKRKLESTLRSLEEQNAKDQILGHEIKTLSCHIHQKSLEMSTLQNQYSLLHNQIENDQQNHDKNVEDMQINLSELQDELDTMRNDKFFLQRLCADLKMSLQGTVNQNKVLQMRLESMENETKNLTVKLYDSLPNIPSPSSNIDEDYINKLLKQSTVLPNKPLKNLRSCLDSLKMEMAALQKEIIAKSHSDIL